MKRFFRIISRLSVAAASIFYLLIMRWFDRCRMRREKVLIVTPLRMGDFAMFMPSAPELIAHFRQKNMQVVLLTTPALFPLAETLGADEIIAHPYPENAVKFSAAYRFCRQIARAGYRIAVVAVTERSFFHDDLPLIYSCAKEIYLPQAVKLPERLWWRLPFILDSIFFRRTVGMTDYVNTPEMQNYARLTAAVTGVLPRCIKPVLPVASEPFFEPGYILFAPGSQDISRCCDAAVLTAVVKHLCRTHRVVIAGSAGEFDRAELLRSGAENCINFCGKSDLPGLLRLISDAAAVVGMDSGIANLAIISGKKCIAALGQANDRFMFIPAEAAEFTAPAVVRKSEMCPQCNCNWNCTFACDGKPYPCLQITAAEFIAVIDRSVEEKL